MDLERHDLTEVSKFCENLDTRKHKLLDLELSCNLPTLLRTSVESLVDMNEEHIVDFQ